jgi:O-antigen ligase
MVQYTRFPLKIRGAVAAGRPAAQGPIIQGHVIVPDEPTGLHTHRPVAGYEGRQTTEPSQTTEKIATSARPLTGVAQNTASLSLVVVALMVAIVMPIFFSAGSLRLSPSRLLLVVLCLPVFFYWLSGKSGRIRAADIFILLYALWIAIAILATEGLAHVEFIGISCIEIFCPYLLARHYIRTEEQYLGLIKVLGVIVLFLAPAAMLEAVTGIRLYTKIFDPLFSVFPSANYEPRWGMTRAQTVFEHPILYGVYVAIFFSPVYFAWRAGHKSAFQAFLLAAPIGVATFFSLSVGAYLGLFIQFLLIGWGYAMRQSPKRWQILTALVALAYVVVDLISNRTPFEVFISYLTFDSSSSYWRVLIFSYGMENVWAHPLFGLGLAEWVRPQWMHSASVDNFWLLSAMRFGIPAFFLIAAVYACVIAGLVRARPAAHSVQQHKLGLLFSLIGLGMAICTVHLWNNTAVFMLFMFGASAWISDVAQEPPQRTDRGTPNAGPGSLRAALPIPAQAAALPATKRLGQTHSPAKQRQARST